MRRATLYPLPDEVSDVEAAELAARWAELMADDPWTWGTARVVQRAGFDNLPGTRHAILTETDHYDDELHA